MRKAWKVSAPMWPWLAASKQTTKTAPIRVPVYPVKGVHRTNNGCVQEYFSFPLLSLPYFDTSASSMESFFDSCQLSVSLNAQINNWLQNMTALQANSGPILFTSKLTEVLQNSIFTYRKYSKQCSRVFNSRHNNDTLLTTFLSYAHDTLGCHSSES